MLHMSELLETDSLHKITKNQTIPDKMTLTMNVVVCFYIATFNLIFA